MGAAYDCAQKDGILPLHLFCYWGWYNALQATVSSQTPGSQAAHKRILIPDTDGSTIFHILAGCDSHATATLLLKALAKGRAISLVNQPNKYVVTPLILACQKGNHMFVQALCSHQIDNINFQGPEGKTALHWAVNAGSVASVNCLLLQGKADPMVCDAAGKTPLRYAVEQGSTALVKILCAQENTARVLNMIDPVTNTTALQRAIQDGKKEITGHLITAGARYDSGGKNGGIPLHVMCDKGWYGLLEKVVHAHTRGSQHTHKYLFTPYADQSTIFHKLAQKGVHTTTHLLLQSLSKEKLLNQVNKANDQDMTPLMIASKTGNDGVVKALCSHQIDNINFQGPEGKTALHWAVNAGSAASVNCLLLQGKADPTVCDAAGKMPLRYAVEQGSTALVKILCAQENTARVLNMIDPVTNTTALQRAIQDGKKEIAGHLITAGARYDSGGKNGGIPLHVMCDKGWYGLLEKVVHAHTRGSQHAHKYLFTPYPDQSTIFHKLAQKGVHTTTHLLLQSLSKEKLLNQVNKANDQDMNPLMIASKTGNDRVVKALCSHQIDNINFQGPEDKTALHWAVNAGSAASVNCLLLQGKADPTVCDAAGKTPLRYAVEQGSTALVKILCAQENTARVLNMIDPVTNTTALQRAIQDGKKEIAGHLITAGARYDSGGKNGGIPLHVMCDKGWYGLLEKVVHANTRGSQHAHKYLLTPYADQSTIFHTLTEKKQYDLLNLLLQVCADQSASLAQAQGPNKHGITPLMQACQQSDQQAVKTLCSQKVTTINFQGPAGKTALHWAVQNQTGVCIDYLMQQAQADATIRDHKGQTPLMIAFDKPEQYADTISTLGAYPGKRIGADLIDPTDKKTCLHKAVMCKNAQYVKLLLNAGADASLVDGDGYTALHYACIAADKKIVALFCELRPDDLSCRGTGGKTPLHGAVQHGHTEVISMLISGREKLIHLEDDTGFTPVHLAASQESSHGLASLTILIDGVTTPQKLLSRYTADKQNIIHCATKTGNLSLLKQVLAYTDQYNLTSTLINQHMGIDDDVHYTPLSLASGQGQLPVVEELLAHGADIAVRDSQGRNALWFVKKDDSITTDLLKKQKADNPLLALQTLYPMSLNQSREMERIIAFLRGDLEANPYRCILVRSTCSVTRHNFVELLCKCVDPAFVSPLQDNKSHIEGLLRFVEQRDLNQALEKSIPDTAPTIVLLKEKVVKKLGPTSMQIINHLCMKKAPIIVILQTADLSCNLSARFDQMLQGLDSFTLDLQRNNYEQALALQVTACPEFKTSPTLVRKAAQKIAQEQSDKPNKNINVLQAFVKKMKTTMGDAKQQEIKPKLIEYFGNYIDSQNSDSQELTSQVSQLFDSIENTMKMDDYICLKRQRRRIKRIFRTVMGEDMHTEQACTLRRTVLFQGPQGLGKTTLAQALARQHNIPCFMCNMKNLIDKDDIDVWLVTLKNAFINAVKNAPSILLLDDVNAVIRRDFAARYPRFTDMLQSQLEKLKDGEWKKKKVLVISTTNAKEGDWDGALAERLIQFPVLFTNPKPEERFILLKYYLTLIEKHIDIPFKLDTSMFVKDSDFHTYFIAKTENLSVRFLRNLFFDFPAWIMDACKDDTITTLSDVKEFLDEILLNSERFLIADWI